MPGGGGGPYPVDRDELIGIKKSIIVATDLPYSKRLLDLIDATADVSKISGYKIGPQSVIRKGMDLLLGTIEDYSNKLDKDITVIYDHQKAGNDIPEFGPKLIEEVAAAGANAVVLFPFAGGKTQREWTKAVWDFGLVPIVGGEMTQSEFLFSEGGYIHDDAPELIYRRAAQQGVKNFVVPGNKPGKVLKYRKILEEEIGKDSFTLYAPGFISQGGNITETGAVAGNRFHAIVGSGIYNASDMHEAALIVTSQI